MKFRFGVRLRDFTVFFVGVISTLFIVAYLQEKSGTVAVVNGKPLSRNLFVNRMTHVCGDDTLNMLLDETLVFQEMQKQNVSVTSKEINIRMRDFRATFPSKEKFEEWQKKHFLSTEDISTQIKMDVGLEKLVGVTLDEKELKKYYTNTKNQYRGKDGELMSFEEAKPQIIAVFAQGKKKDYLERLRHSARIKKLPLLAPLSENK